MKLKKISKFKNYISANIISLCGYLYNIHLYFYNKQATRIFSDLGADETSEAYAHTFLYFLVIALYFVIIILLILICVIEHIVQKKYSINILNNIELNKLINKFYNILFWIGIILVLKTLIPTSIFLIFALFDNIFKLII